MTYLLDASALIARFVADHIHHRSAQLWLLENPGFSVCPLTEGALLRYTLRSHPNSSDRASTLLRMIAAQPGYHFWPDDISHSVIDLPRIGGHGQVTDAYLVALARAHGSRLATFDQALAAVHPEAVLVPLVD